MFIQAVLQDKVCCCPAGVLQGIKELLYSEDVPVSPCCYAISLDNTTVPTEVLRLLCHICIDLTAFLNEIGLFCLGVKINVQRTR